MHIITKTAFLHTNNLIFFFTSRTLNDVADTTSVKRKEIAKNYRRLVFELDVKSPAIDPMKCIAKIANNANITERTKREAMEIMADVIRKESSAGKEPMGLASNCTLCILQKDW